MVRTVEVAVLAVGAGLLVASEWFHRRRRKEKQTTQDEVKCAPDLLTVAVFWDIENLNIPSNVDVACLGNAIQDLARSISPSVNLEFVNAYIDTQQLSTGHANTLSQLGLNIIHSPIAKEAADKAIIVDLLIWLLQYEKSNSSGGLPCVVLITRDHDFEPLLYKLRNIRNCHAVLVTEVNRVRPHFLQAPNEYFDWKEVVAVAKAEQERLGLSVRRHIYRTNSWRKTKAARKQFKGRRARRSSLSPSRHEKPYVEGEDDADSNDESDSSVRSNGGNTSTTKVVKRIKRPYSSFKPKSHPVEDEIADFVLHALICNKRDLSTAAIFRLLKNPGARGGYNLYNAASSQDSQGRHVLFAVIKAHRERFVMYKSHHGIWFVKLVGKDHEYLSEAYRQDASCLSCESSSEAEPNEDVPRASRKATSWSYELLAPKEDQ